MLSTEEVKQNIITSDIKLVSYSSTITKMHGPIYIRQEELFVEILATEGNFKFVFSPLKDTVD